MKKSLLAFSLLFSALAAHAGDDQFTAPVYATKIDGLLNQCRAREESSPKTSIFTVFLLGDAVLPVINNASAGRLWLDTMKDLADARHYEIVGRVNTWYAAQAGLCKKIVKANPDKIVVVGHSAGAVGARTLAKCLKKSNRDIDVLITIAGFDYNEPVTEENVRTQYNYVVKTVFLQGSDKTSNGTSKTLNFHAVMESDGWAHYESATKMAPLIALQAYADLEGLSDKMTIADGFAMETAQTNLEKFIDCGSRN